MTKLLAISYKKEHVLYWFCFILFFLYGWQNYKIFTHIPAYGDSLEVIWGITWYNHALKEGVTPFFYPYIFHPEGWQVGLLAHTPILFLLAQPFLLLGGKIFAYNILAIIPFFISYAGSLRFVGHYNKSIVVRIAISLGFTFVFMRSERVVGHLHILWATSFLPLLADHILSWRKLEDEPILHKHLFLSALYASLAVSFSLYSVFLAPILFLLLERKLFDLRRIAIQGVLVISIVALISSTAVLPYLYAVQIEPVKSPNITELIFWSTNINSVFVPSVNHSLPFLRSISNYFVSTSIGGEARSANMGLSTLILLAVGIYGLVKQKRQYGILLVFAIPFILGMGPILKFDNEPVVSDSFSDINETLWTLAHRAKPDTFMQELPIDQMADSIPLPGYLFYAFVPFAESARTVSRFTMLTFLGALGLLAIGFNHLPKSLKYILLIIWLIEMLPYQAKAAYLPTDRLHPAYEWLRDNTNMDDAIIDIQGNRLYQGSLPLYMSWEVKRPTAATVGSFRPEHNRVLFLETQQFMDQELKHLAKIYDSYNIKHVVVHNRYGQKAWNHLQSDHDVFRPVGCFLPIEEESPWSYEICVAEVVSHPTIKNVYSDFGFSEPYEAWGTWSIDQQPRLNFLATAETSHVVVLEAFPHCIADKSQTMRMISNDVIVYEFAWNDCESTYAEVIIPADQIQIGRNEIRFEMEYALSPAELGLGNDPRPLAVGFSRLEIRQID